jgi:hypothetical protein
MQTTISNEHITDHEEISGLFIREVNHPEHGHYFMVLHADDGAYSGKYSDGSDCKFDTIDEATRFLGSLTE